MYNRKIKKQWFSRRLKSFSALCMALILSITGCGKKETDYEVDYYSENTTQNENSESVENPEPNSGDNSEEAVADPTTSSNDSLSEMLGGDQLYLADNMTVHGVDIEFSLLYDVDHNIDRLPTYSASPIELADVKEDEIVKNLFGDTAIPLNGSNEKEFNNIDDKDNMIYQCFSAVVAYNNRYEGNISYYNFSSWIDETDYFSHVYQGIYNGIDYYLAIGYSNIFKEMYVAFYPIYVGDVVGDRSLDHIIVTGPDGLIYFNQTGDMQAVDINSVMADRPNESKLTDDELVSMVKDTLHNKFYMDLPEDGISLYENIYSNYVINSDEDDLQKCEVVFINEDSFDFTNLEGAVRHGYIAPFTNNIHHLPVIPSTDSLNPYAGDLKGGMLVVDDEGLKGINLCISYNFEEVLSENASLISFERAMEAMEKNIADNPDFIVGSGKKFNDIDLMYYPVPSPDNPKECTFIPAWVISEEKGVSTTARIVINAIDGSYITGIFKDK